MITHHKLSVNNNIIKNVDIGENYLIVDIRAII